MKIKEMFSRSIDRNIQGVIKVGQEGNILQELDEYVVTSELQKEFAKFFSAYDAALQAPTDEMGVWISGFFGSGKSHFLKIIGDILDNKTAAGKPAVEYFQSKINDPLTYTQMVHAAEAKTDVILFNIDSKAQSGDKDADDVIVKVFLQVFNEMQGFSSANLWIADLERQLTVDGQYETFKAAFQSLQSKHLDWSVGRDHFAFNKGTIRDALIQIGYKSEADAQGFIDQLLQPYEISIESFAQLVADYIQQTGHPVAFLVDEVGQFIGDSTDRMLNLQTVVEELGKAAQGKAWVVVTSQQDIAQVTNNINGIDFSKIQGRFKTRVALSSANVDDVIKRRLLAKRPTCQQELENFYTGESATLNNVIDFTDGYQPAKFDSAETFAADYPFLPYQFDLLQDVLTAVRTHGSDGKHLSEGERSMLSIFQESAIRLENQDEGTLVPFSLFFDGLAQFLDHTHQIVIQRALDDHEVINPSRDANPFAVQVLKTLFMVKYLQDGFKATLDNIVTLMIDRTDVDRVALTKQVQRALNDLITQHYVEKNMNTYVFLTDAEQEINQTIEKQQVDDAEVRTELAQFIFNSKVIDSKFNYPKLNGRYSFTVNDYLDDVSYGRNNHELSIRVITPLADQYRDEQSILMHSMGEGRELFVVMPDRDDYLTTVRRELRVRKFLRDSRGNQDAHYQNLVQARNAEYSDLQIAAEQQAVTALNDAKVYYGGAQIEAKTDFFNQLATGLKAMIDDNYRQLAYIDTPKNDRDITALFTDHGGMVDEHANQQAIAALHDWLQRSTTPQVTLRSIFSVFQGIPYGYTEEDIEWLVAKLFVDSQIKLTYNGESVSLVSGKYNAKQLTELLTKRVNFEKVAVRLRKVTNERDMRAFREVASEVFNKKSFSRQDLEGVVGELKAKIESDLSLLRNFQHKSPRYPGLNILDQGIELINRIPLNRDSDEIIAKIVANKDELLDWHEDYVDSGIADFYLSDSQQKIWDAGLDAIDRFADSKDFLHEEALSKTVTELQSLIKANRVTAVPQIKALTETFIDQYNQAFDDKLDDILRQIKDIADEAKEALARAGVGEDFATEHQRRFVARIDQIEEEAKNARSLNDLIVKPAQAQNQADQLSEETNQEANRLKRVQPVQPVNPTLNPVDPVTTVAPTPRSIIQVSATELAGRQTWKIERPADVDQYLAELKQQLLKRLAGNDEVDVRF